jgi:hypothetical protein
MALLKSGRGGISNKPQIAAPSHLPQVLRSSVTSGRPPDGSAAWLSWLSIKTHRVFGAPSPNAFKFHCEQMVQPAAMFRGIKSPNGSFSYMLSRNIILNPCCAARDNHLPVGQPIVEAAFNRVLLMPKIPQPLYRCRDSLSVFCNRLAYRRGSSSRVITI